MVEGQPLNLMESIMPNCEKCCTEYEPEVDCICSAYRRWCEDGQQWRAPLWWRKEWWHDGYLLSPEECNHPRMQRLPNGGDRCKECGLAWGPQDLLPSTFWHVPVDDN